MLYCFGPTCYPLTKPHTISAVITEVLYVFSVFFSFHPFVVLLWVYFTFIWYIVQCTVRLSSHDRGATSPNTFLDTLCIFPSPPCILLGRLRTASQLAHTGHASPVTSPDFSKVSSATSTNTCSSSRHIHFTMNPHRTSYANWKRMAAVEGAWGLKSQKKAATLSVSR